MKFEKLEKANKKELRREVVDRFNRYNAEAPGGIEYLWEAQFYMGELDRRSGSRIALRDFILEIVVIVLIGIEIGLAIKQGKDEDKLMDKQNGILTKLQDASSDTAKSMKALADVTKAMSDNTSASARTLLSLRSTTETMNKATQSQLALFYDVGVTLLYDAAQKKLTIVNNGRTNVMMWGEKFSDWPMQINPEARIIIPGSGWVIPADVFFKAMDDKVPKGSTVSVPYFLYLKNAHGEQFVLGARLLFEWDKDALTMRTMTNAITPEHWDRNGTQKSK